MKIQIIVDISKSVDNRQICKSLPIFLLNEIVECIRKVGCKRMTQLFEKPISVDQALIMGLRMHDRGDCGLVRAIITGFELRYQINFLSGMGISRRDFENLIGRSRDILDDWK